MPTATIEDFRLGLDTRKSILTGEPGSLQQLQDCVINSGGEIEKRLAFVLMENPLPPSTGLYGTSAGVHIFGTTPAVTYPPNPAPGRPDPLTLEHFDAPTAGLNYTIIDVQPFLNIFWMSYIQNSNGALFNNWNGNIYAYTTAGDYARVYKSKVYRTNNQYLRFSAINNPDSDENTTADPGGGFIDVSVNDPDSDLVSGLELYYSSMAIFGRHTTQIWSLDPDPALNALTQVVRVGTISPKSVLQYQTGDVLFLSDSGIRSLRAANYTLAAGVIDIGSPVDSLVKAAVAALNFNAIAAMPRLGIQYAIRSVVEPVTGRFWMAIGNRIFVLSYYPSAKISAWSMFTTPFNYVTGFAVVGNHLYIRDDVSRLWLYGGVDGATYDATPAIVQLPYTSLGKPNVEKKIKAVSTICEGAWSLGLGTLADNTGVYEPIANIVNSTVTQNRLGALGKGTHMSLQFVSTGTGFAGISSASIDYDATVTL